MNNVINFNQSKKKYIPAVIHIGDLVEWQDYNGQIYDGIILKIEHIPLEGFKIGESLDRFPLWEKEDYTVTFRNGLEVAGSAIVAKIIRKGFKSEKPFMPRSFLNGH